MSGVEGARRAGGSPEPLGNVLAGYLDRTGLAEAIGRQGALDEWADAVGPRVGRVTRAVEVKGDTLIVEVISSAWLAELSMMRPLILGQVNEVRTGPAIGGIRFRLAETDGAATSAARGGASDTD